MANNDLTVSRFDLKEWRERFILTVLRIASVLGVFLIVASFATATLNDKILFIGSYFVLVMATVLPVSYRLRASVLLLIVFAVGVNAILAWGPWADGNIFLLSTVVLATLLLDDRTDIISLTISILFMCIIAGMIQAGIFQLTAAAAPPTKFESWAVYIVDFAIAGIVITAAGNQLKNAFTRVADQIQAAFQALSEERKNLEVKVQERTEELETRMTQLRESTLTARAIAETQDINELLNRASRLISDRFGFYHVGIFILDDQRKNAYLQSASSEAGKNLVGQALRIESDKRSPLAFVVANNKALISTDSDQATFARDPNFPLTRSRMLLPLSLRGAVIGLVDMHSEQPQAFGQQEAEILQTLADLIAISFDNVRLIDETRFLLNQLETNTSIQTKRTWSKLTSRRKTAYLYTPAGVRPVFAPNKQEQNEGLFVPILLQGQVIGRIKLKRKGLESAWSDRERDLVEKIAVQVALALENSRLVDEAQRNALRNQMIANFSTYVRETLDIDSVIRTAATELRKVFDLKEAEILIGPSHSEIIQSSQHSN